MHQKPTRSVRGDRREIHHSAKADPGAEAVLAEQKQAILELFAQGEAAHWKIGQRYNKIVRERLAEKAGYDRARDFFAAEVKALPQATLSGYGRVAKTFTEEIAGRYGVTKLNLLLVWRKLTHAGPVEGEPGAIEIDIPGKDGSTRRKRFADVTARELSRAIRRIKGPPPPAEPRLPPLEKRIMDAMSRVVADHYGPKFQVGFKVQARGGKAYFSLQNVPLEVMDDLFDSLFSAEWNERDRQEANPPPAPQHQAPRQPRSRRLEAPRAPAAKPERRQPASFQAPGREAGGWRGSAGGGVSLDFEETSQDHARSRAHSSGEGSLRRSKGTPTTSVRLAGRSARAGAGRRSAFEAALSGSATTRSAISTSATRASGRAPANLREAVISPHERVQVRGVVEIERRIREPHNPPARRSAPRP